MFFGRCRLAVGGTASTVVVGGCWWRVGMGGWYDMFLSCCGVAVVVVVVVVVVAVVCGVSLRCVLAAHCLAHPSAVGVGGPAVVAKTGTGRLGKPGSPGGPGKTRAGGRSR